MAENKKIEFEVVINTTSADNTVLGVEKKILSLTSNLKESLNKLEVLKKTLEAAGERFPALEALKKFQDELNKATRGTAALKDEETKKLLKEFIAAAGKTSLPSKLSNALQSVNKQGVPLSVGDLTSKHRDALEKIYSGISPKLSGGLSQRLQKELEKSLQNGVLNISRLGEAKSSARNSIRFKSIDARLQDSFEQALAEKVASFKAWPKVNPYQNPSQRQTEIFQQQFEPRKSFKGLISLSSTALDSGDRIKAATEAAYQQHKSLSLVQKEELRLQALQKQLETIQPNSRLAEFWAKTAEHIQNAKSALSDYIKTEKSLKFQSGLNNSILPFGQKQLSKAQFENQYPLQDGKLSARAKQEASASLAQVNKRFDNLLQNTTSKVDGTTDKGQRTQLLSRMRELGQTAQREIYNTNLEGAAKEITAGIKDQISALRESLVVKTAIKQKDQEISDLLAHIKSSTLSGALVRELTQESKNAKIALQELDALQRKINSDSKKNAALSSSMSSGMQGAETNLRKTDLTGAKAKEEFGKQQSLAILAAQAAKSLAKINNALNVATTDSQRAKLSAQANKVISQYEAKASDTSLNRNALGTLKEMTELYQKDLALLTQQNTLKEQLKRKDQEILDILHKVQAANLPTAVLANLTQEADRARQALKALNSQQTSMQKNETKNSAVQGYSSSLLGQVEARQRLGVVENRYGTSSIQALNLSEQQQLARVRARAEVEMQRASASLTAQSSGADRANAARQIRATATEYDRASRSIMTQTQAMRESALATIAHTRASSNLMLKISEYVIGYRAVNFALDTFTNFLSNIPDAGIKLENVNAVFKAMFVTTRDVNEQFTFLDAVADRTGSRLRSLRGEFADFSASAKAANESTQNIQESFANLTDAATVLHLPEDKVHGALIAISQMYAKNQVMSEELKRQLGNVLPGAVAMFARSQNMSTKELLEQMKVGNVRPKDTVPQFLKFYKEVFAPEDAFNAASKGFYATLGHFQNEYTRLSEDIYKKSSEDLIGFTNVGTSGLKLVRENLDGIAVVLKNIGILAGVAGSMSLFSAGRTFLAKKAITAENTNILSRSSRAGNIFPRTLSAENPAVLAQFSTAAMLVPNAISVVAKSIASIHPAIKLAVLGLAAVDLAWKRIENLPDIDLGDGIKVSSVELSKDRLDQIYESYLRIVNSAPATSFEKFIVKLGEMDTALNYALDLFVFSPTINKLFLSEIDEEEKARLKEKKILEKREASYKTFRENILLESQKALLAEPSTSVENLFDAKSFTRTIELVGRAVTSQITSISEIANIQLRQLEQRAARIDKRASRGLLSPGSIYEQKMQIIGEKSALQSSLVNEKQRLNLVPVALDKQFSSKNEILSNLEKRVQELKDKIAANRYIAEGVTSLQVKQADGQIEEKSYSGLGYVVSADRNSPHYLTKAQQDAKDSEVGKLREQYLRDFEANQEYNKGVKPAFQGVAAHVTESDINQAITQQKEALQKLNSAMEALQATVVQLDNLYQGQVSEVLTPTQNRSIQFSKVIPKQVQIDESLKTPIVDRPTSLEGKSKKRFSLFGVNIDVIYKTGESSETSSSTNLTKQAMAPVLAKASEKQKQWTELASTLEKQYGLPNNLLIASMQAESGGNFNAVSPKGAGGLMQLMPDTAKRFGVADRFDPEQNLQGAAKYYDFLYNKNAGTKGNLPLTIAGYNAGEGAVNKYQGMPPYSETQNYTQKVLDYITQADKNIQPFISALDKNLNLPKQDRVAGAAATSYGYRYQEQVNNADIERMQNQAALQAEISNTTEDLNYAMEDLRLSIEQQVGVPYKQLSNPLSIDRVIEPLNESFRVLEKTLTDEKARSPNSKLRTFSDERLAEIERQLTQIRVLTGENFKRDQRDQIRGEQDRSLQINKDLTQSRYEFNRASPLHQAATIAKLSAKDLANKQTNRASYVADQLNDPRIPKNTALNNIAQYDAEIEKLKESMNEVNNYFNTTLSQSMQQPLKDFLFGMSSAEESLKAFGRNFLSSIADNIITSMANEVGRMLTEAASRAAISSGMSSIFGSLFGGAASSAGSSAASSAAESGISSSISSLLSSGFAYAKDGGSIQGFADGGSPDGIQYLTKSQQIKGAGTSRSDSIDAIVPIGSYILNAEASKRVKLSDSEIFISPTDVKNIGQDKLDVLNFGGNFASGGSVGGNLRPSGSLNTAIPVGDTYNITIEMTSSKDPKKDGETAAVRMMEVIAQRAASAVAAKTMQIHEKARHSGRN